MFKFEFDHLDWLHSFPVNEDKLENQWILRFLPRSGYAILVKIWKWLKLLNSFPFIKKTLVNHVYIRIWSFWLSFTVLQWMKKNCKISQFSRFSAKIRLSDIGQNLIMTKTSFWLTYSEWRQTSKSVNWRFLRRSGYAILVKIWKWIKLLNSVRFIKKTLVNHVYIRIWWSWLTFTILQWMKTNFKISQFSRFLLRSKYAIQVKISKRTETS